MDEIKTLKDLRRMWITKFEPEDSETDIELSEFEITAKGRMEDFVDTVNWKDFCKNKEVPTVLLDSDLKQEAIKQIKGEDGNFVTESTEEWIKHFFNITEEDLK